MDHQVIARQISMPRNAKPLRFPSFPALERTATIGFNKTSTMSVAANGTRALLSRQAGYPLWVDQSIAVLATAFYNFDISPDTAGTRGYATFNFERPKAVLTSGTMTFAIGYTTGPMNWSLTHFSNTNFNDNTPWGVDGSEKIWVPVAQGCDIVPVVMAQFSGGTIIQIVIEKFSYDGTHNVITLEETVPSDNLYHQFAGQNALGGYYRVKSVTIIGPTSSAALSSNGCVLLMTGSTTIPPVFTSSTVTQIGSINYTASTEVHLWPYPLPKDYSVTSVPWQSTRLTAVATLFTNVTKIMNKEGTVLAGRLNPRNSDIFGFSAGDLQSLHPSEKFFDSLEHGLYTFCPPSTDLVGFYDYTAFLPVSYSVGQEAPVPVMVLNNDALVNCIYFADPDGDTALAINTDIHMEFRSTSTLWPIGMSSASLESLHRAQLDLASKGYFFRNDAHLTILNRMIKGVARKVKNARRSKKKVKVNNQPSLGKKDLIMSTKPQKVIQTTTMKASGWDDGQKRGGRRSRSRSQSKSRRGK